MSDDDQGPQLDDIKTLIQLVFRRELADARAELRKDPIDAELFDRTAGGWVGSGDLQRTVAKSQKSSERSVRNHLAALVEQGLLRQDGDGSKRRYRSSGLV